MTEERQDTPASPAPEGGTGAHDEPPRALPSPAGAWTRNFGIRAAAGVPVLLVLLLLIALAPLRVLSLLVAAAGVYGIYEFVRLVDGGLGIRLPLAPLLFAATAIGLGGVIGSPAALGAGLLVGGGLLFWVHWFAAPAAGREGLQELGVGLTGLLMVPWLLNHVGLVAQEPAGRGFLAFLLVAVSLSDTFAYLVGTLFGRWPLLPAVSPRKTVEGAVGGVAGGALGGVVASLWMGGGPTPYGFLELILLGGLLAVAGQAGDLLESKLKRLNGADDSGNFLPGHGGLLDRVDAYLIAAPLSFYLLRWAAG
jgi:phosphatidate cytidylyltransferase